MTDPDQLGKAFTDHYYSTFDTNRPALAGLYQESSLLTFEGQKTQGAQAIIQKLQGLPFQACKHHVDSLDAQPSPSGGMNIFVTGRLQPDGETQVLKFSQFFHLVPAGQSFAVTNDIFRLNYA